MTYMLSTEEREIVISKADDQEEWHVFTESKQGLARRLVRIAKKLERPITAHGEHGGVEFTLPLWVLTARAAPQKVTNPGGGDVRHLRAGRVQGG